MKKSSFIILLALLPCLLGCDGERDHSIDGRGYQPLAGQGAILIENDTIKDWNIAIDNNLVGRVAEGNFVVRDHAPGTYAVHLDEHEGSKEHDRAVGVVEGKVVVVRISGEPPGFDVDVVTLEP